MKLLKNVVPILSGIEMGIPLNLISKIAIDINYPNTIITKESILINFLLGFTAYKQDRYMDAQENILLNYSKFSNSKNEYYISLLDNEKFIQFTLFCCYIIISTLCLSPNNDLKIIPPIFTSTFLYKYYKKNKNISFLKPFCVASMWTFSTCIIPLLANNDYSDINLSLLVPTFLNLFALTNLEDLKDYNEDFENKINTLSIILGISKIKNIILFSITLSTILFIDSPFYTNNFQNILYISSNLLPYFSLLNYTN